MNQPLTPEIVATLPLPGMAVPASLAFSPDDQLISYLRSPDGSLARQLYAFDPDSGTERLLLAPPEGGTTEQNVSLEEALRRERQRQLEVGVTSYAWATQGRRLLVPLAGALYLQDGLDAPLHQLVARGSEPPLDARFSPDGAWVAYVQASELWVVPTAGGPPRQLTTGARDTGRTNGLAEYAAQEEMGRSQGYWWSRDSRWLAFAEVDETHIPIYRIVHQGKETTGSGAQEDHRYPFAGQPNARVRLGVVPLSGGAPIWMDLGSDPDIYLARVEWLPDGSLLAQRLNRTQTQLDLLRFDPASGAATSFLQETSDVWINLHNLLTPLDDGSLIWGSERSGFLHLYHYAADGQLIRQLTTGDWLVDSIAGVDQAQGRVYFTGTLDGPTECQLYMVLLAGGAPRRISRGAGMHSVVLDHARQRFLDLYHTLGQPPTLMLCALADGAPLATIFHNTDPRVAGLALPPPELVQISNRDGIVLYGALFRPPATAGAGPFPAIVSVYGGPHAQRVTNGWSTTVQLRAQYLASLGFVVLALDNRGSARRGLAFEAAIKHNLGNLEVSDQVDGVRWLVAQRLADPARVGVYGWSYGGYMALMCLARAPETFRVAVAGAPVTHWDGYDTCYSERYMGLPHDNPHGYQQSSVMQHVAALRGKLLLVHGLIDENVHFRHTARLINALIRARKPYDLLLFPDERHSPRSLADRVFMEEQIRDYFLAHLGDSGSIATLPEL